MRSRRWKLGAVLLSFVLAVSTAVPSAAFAEIGAGAAAPVATGDDEGASGGEASEPSITVEPSSPDDGATGPSITVEPSDPVDPPAADDAEADVVDPGQDPSVTDDPAVPTDEGPQILVLEPDAAPVDPDPGSVDSSTYTGTLYFGPRNNVEGNEWSLFIDRTCTTPYTGQESAWEVSDQTLTLNGFQYTAEKCDVGLYATFYAKGARIELAAGSDNRIVLDHQGVPLTDHSAALRAENDLAIVGEGTLRLTAGTSAASSGAAACDSVGLYAGSLTIAQVEVWAEGGTAGSGSAAGAEVADSVVLDGAILHAVDGNVARGFSSGLRCQKLDMRPSSAAPAELDARGLDSGVALSNEPQIAGNASLLGSTVRAGDADRPVTYKNSGVYVIAETYETARHVSITASTMPNHSLYLGKANGTMGLYCDRNLTVPYTKGKGASWDFDQDGQLWLNNFEFVTTAPVALECLEGISTINLTPGTVNRLASLSEGASRTAGIHSDHHVVIGRGAASVPTLEVQGGHALSTGTTAGIEADEVSVISDDSQTIVARGGDGGTSLGIKARRATLGHHVVAEGATAGLSVSSTLLLRDAVAVLGREDVAGDQLTPAQHDKASTYFQVNGKVARHVETGLKGGSRLYLGPYGRDAANDWSLFTNSELTQKYDGNRGFWSVAKRSDGTPELKLSGFSYLSSDEAALEVWSNTATSGGTIAIVLAAGTQNLLAVERADGSGTALDAGPSNRLVIEGLGSLEATSRTSGTSTHSTGIFAKALDLDGGATVNALAWHGGTSSSDLCVGVRTAEGGAISNGTLHAAGDSASVWSDKAFGPAGLVDAQGRADRSDGDFKEARFNESSHVYESSGERNRETSLSSLTFEGPLYFAPKDRANASGDWTLYTDAEYRSEFPANDRWSAQGSKLTLKNFTYKTTSAVALSVYDAPAEIAFVGANDLEGNGPSDKEDAAAIKATAPLVIMGSAGATLRTVGSQAGLMSRKSSGIDAGELTLRNANIEALGSPSVEKGSAYGIRATGLTVSNSTVNARGGGSESGTFTCYGIHVRKAAEGAGGVLKVEASKVYAQGFSAAAFAEGGAETKYLQVMGSERGTGDAFEAAHYDALSKRFKTASASARQLKIGEAASGTLYFGPQGRNPSNGWSLYTDEGCTQLYQEQIGNWSVRGKTLQLMGFSYYTAAGTALYLHDGASLTLTRDNVVASVGEGAGQKRGVKAESDVTIDGQGSLSAIAAPSSGSGDSIGFEAAHVAQTGYGALRAEGRQAAGGSSYGFHVEKLELTQGGSIAALGYTAGLYSSDEPHLFNRTVKGRVDRDGTDALKDASYSATSKCYEVGGRAAGFVSARDPLPGSLYFGSVDGVWSLYTDPGRTQPYTGGGSSWSVDGNTLVLSHFTYASNTDTALVIQGNAKIRLKEGTSTIECLNSVSINSTHALEAPDGLTIEGADGAVLEVKASGGSLREDGQDDGDASAQGDTAEDGYNAAVNVGKDLVIEGGLIKATATGGMNRRLAHGIACAGKTTFRDGAVVATGEGEHAGNGLRSEALSFEGGSFEGMGSGRIGGGALWVNTETTPFGDNVDILGGGARDDQDLAEPAWDQYAHALARGGVPCKYARITSEDTSLYFGPRDDSQFNKWSLFTDPHYTIEYAGQRDAWRVFGTLLVLNNFSLSTSKSTALHVKKDDDACIAAASGSSNIIKSTAVGEEETYGILAYGSLDISGSEGALAVTGGSACVGGESCGVKADELKVDNTTLTAAGDTAGVMAASEPVTSVPAWGGTSKSGGQLKAASWQGDRYRVDGASARYVRFSQYNPEGALYFGPAGNVPGGAWSLYSDAALTHEYEGKGATWSVEGKNLKLNNFDYRTDGILGLSVSADPDATITLEPGTQNTIRCDAWNDTSVDTVAALHADGSLALAGEGELTVTAGGVWTRGDRYGIDAGSLTITANDVTAIGDTAGVHASAEPAHPGLKVKGSADRYGSDLKDVTWSEGRYLAGTTPARFVEFKNDLSAAGLYFDGVGAEWSLYTDAYKTQEYPGKGVTWSAAGHTLTLMGLQFETWGETALTVGAAADAAIVLAPQSVSAFKSTAKNASASYGVYAKGSLTIGGSGTLIASGGDAGEGDASAGLFSLGALTVNGGQLSLEGGAGDQSVGLSALMEGTIRGGIVDAKGDTGGAQTFRPGGLALENGVQAEGAVARDGDALKPAAYDGASGYYRVDGANARHARFSAPLNPVIAADPGLLAFGMQPVDVKSAEQRVKVSASELLADMTIEAPEGFTVVPAEGWSPRLGGELRVTFNPAEAKSYGGVLWLRSEGASDVPVVLTGEGRASALVVDQGLLAFGYQAVATKSAEQRVEVTASGLKGDIAIEEPEGFAVVPADGWNPRTGGELRVTFDPTEAKSYGGMLWLRAQGTPEGLAVPVTLTGEGRQTTVEVSAGRLSFGAQPVATKSAEQRVRVKASGLEGDLEIAEPEGFTVVAADGWDPRTGGELRVTFDPLQAKPYGGMLQVGAEGAEGALVALVGEGRDVGVAADPGLLAFGFQGVGSESAALKVRVAASGLSSNLAYDVPEGFKVTPADGWSPREGGTLLVTFAPTEVKSYAGVLWVGTDGADAAPVALTGEGEPATIKVEPTALDFGDQTIGTKSAEQRVTVTASGLASDLAFDVPTGFAVEPADGWNARTGGQLRVSFTPTEGNFYQGELTIRSGAVKATPVSLKGRGTAPHVTVTPSYVQFGTQPVGTESAEQRITVTTINTHADLDITVPDGFKMEKAPGWDDREGGQLIVRFCPTEAKAYFDSLKVKSEGVEDSALLGGTGVQASIKASPEKLDFGGQAVGTKSAARLVEVSAANLSADLRFSAPEGFSMEPAPGWNARTGGTLRVTFAPERGGTCAGLLQISAENATGASVALAGEGRVANIEASPGTLAFGPQPVATKSAEQRVKVSASGLAEDMAISAGEGFTATPAEGWNPRTGGELRVTFDPSEARNYGEMLRIEAGGAAALVALTGEGRAAMVLATPDHLDFGPQAVGTKSAEQRVQVAATGLTGDLAWDAPAGFTVVEADGWDARTGGTLRVTFDPTDEKGYAGELRVSADGADGATVALSGEGRTATVTATPGQLDFGGQAVGTKSAEQRVQVSASGLDHDMTIGALDGFTVTKADGWDDRTGGDLRVTFDPKEEKRYGEVLVIDADGVDAAQVALLGTGWSASIAVDPGLVAFGFQAVGTKSAEQRVRVTASGLSHDIGFTAPDGFTVVPAEGWNDRTGGELRVTFDPTEAKPYGAVMWVGADGADGVPVTLTGEGEASGIAASPSRLSFGSQPVGTKSAEQRVRVTASGLTGDLSYEAPDGFTVTPAEGWDARTGGTLRVTFDPAEAKPYGGALRLEADGGGAATVMLDGVGRTAAIAVDPGLLAFGNQPVNTTSVEQTVKVVASGLTSDLTYTEPDGFSITPEADWDKRTGGTLRIAFTPDAVKSYGAVMWVGADGADAAPLTLTGEGRATAIAADPGLLAFGYVPVGERGAAQTIAVAASGLSGELAWDVPDGFTVEPGLDWDDRTGGTLNVTFAPTESKSYGAVMWIEADGADAAPVTLTGQGHQSSIAASPELLEFDPQQVGTKSAERLVRVTADDVTSDLILEVPDDFTAVPADGWDPLAGGTLRVTFDPTDEKTYGEVLWVRAGADAAGVALLGEGRAARIDAAPGRLDFGSQAVATKSPERLVRVTASGLEHDLTIDAPAGFTVTPAGGWSPRTGGTLRVTFDPAEAKSYGGVLRIGADGADAASVTLTGRGTASSIAAIPGLVAFGFQPVGTKSAEQLVQVKADGLTGDLSYDGPEGFTVTPAEGWNARTGGTLRITFDPTEATSYGAVMWVEADGTDGVPVALTGEGRTAKIEAAPSRLDFGGQAVATKSLEKLVEVKADGLESDLTIDAPEGFTVVSASGWDARTGGTLRVTFDPAEEKSYGGVLRIGADGADAASVTLTGRGTTSSIAADPGLVAFGFQPVSTMSAERLVHVEAHGLTGDLSYDAPAGFKVVPAEGWSARTGGDLRVVFNPLEAKSYGGVLWVGADGADAAPVTLTGEGRAPAVKAAPSRLSFGRQAVGTKSAEQRVKVDASGLTGDLTLDSPQGFTVVPADGWDDRAGGTLRVTFDPTEARNYGGVLRIAADGADGASVSLAGEGYAASIVADPGLVAFGFQPVGTKSAEQRVRVEASGLGHDMTLDAPDGFTVVPAEGWDPLTGGELRVTFDPTEAKAYGGVLAVEADGADAAFVALTGEGRQSAVRATPALLAFGDQPVATKSAEQRVRVAASGLSSDLTFGAPQGFTVTPAEGWDARTGGELRVTFDPLEAKGYGGMLWIDSDGTDAAFVALTGEGSAPAIKATPDRLVFGNQVVATKSAEQRVRVAASGLSGNLTFDAPTGFTVTPAEGWNNRTGGELRVTFDPTEAKSYGEMLWIESDGADGTAIALTGEGRDSAVKVDTGNLAFGVQPVATKSAEQRVRVAASGLTSDLVIGEPDGFTVVPAEGWDARTGGELRVTFDPTEAKPYGEIMWVSADGADGAPVGLTGEGRQSAVKATPELLAFGKQEVGTRSAEQLVSVQASGLSSDLTFDAPAGFTVVPAGGWDARAGGALRVTFDPTEVKAYGGVLWIGADGADAAPVALTGEGTKPAPPVPPKPKPTPPVPPPAPKPPTPLTGDPLPVAGLTMVALLAAAVAGVAWQRRRKGSR